MPVRKMHADAAASTQKHRQMQAWPEAGRRAARPGQRT